MRRDGPGARLLPPLPGLTRPAAAIPSDKSLGYCRSSLPGLKTKSGPVSFAAKRKPHRPGNATALGLRAGRSRLRGAADYDKQQTMHPVRAAAVIPKVAAICAPHLWRRLMKGKVVFLESAQRAFAEVHASKASPLLSRSYRQRLVSRGCHALYRWYIGRSQQIAAVSTLCDGLQGVRENIGADEWVTKVIPMCRCHPIHALLLEDPYTNRALRKPRGYAGDAETQVNGNRLWPFARASASLSVSA